MQFKSPFSYEPKRNESIKKHYLTVVKRDKIVWMKDLAVSSEADTGE